MDISTTIGMVAGLALILVSIIMGSPLSAFINIPSLVVVVGGTICATLVTENLGNCLGGMKIMMKSFFGKPPNTTETIAKIAELSGVVRKEGLLALENQQIEDEFLGKGVRFAIDGLPAEDIRSAMRAELFSLKERHKRGQQMFRFMSATAPAMGMIGTLIGLVTMLRSLDDPSSIGPSMAVALLTTLYGAVLAFMIFGPIAEKLDVRSKEETANMLVVIEGLESILKGENGRVVTEKLEGHLAPKERGQAEAA